MPQPIPSVSSIAPLTFQDLRPTLRPIERAFLREFKTLLREGRFIGGREVETFENAFAFAAAQGFPGESTDSAPRIHESPPWQAISLSSGTTALHLALMAAGVGPGDEVILPAFTFPGTGWGVLYLGAKPRFADVSPVSAQIDPESVARLLTKRTKAVIAVHLFGHAAPLPELRALLRGKRIALIEDAAQAHGGSLDGRALGTFGDFGCFSFYPTKNLGGMGDGGLVLTRSHRAARALRRWRDQGAAQPFLPETIGFNARLDAAKALFLRLKLPHVSAWNAQRRKAAEAYLQALTATSSRSSGSAPLTRFGLGALAAPEIGGSRGSKESAQSVSPLLPGQGESAWHAFIVKAKRRQAFAAALDAVGLPSRAYYPKALPDLKPFAPETDPVPHARTWAREALALPLYPGLPPEAAKRLRAAL